MTINKCRTCEHAFTTGKDRLYCKKSLADKDDCGEYEELKKSDLLIVKLKPGINLKADLMDHWRKEILRQKETGTVLLPWFLEAIVVPKDIELKVEDQIYICDPDKSPCKYSDICYQPGGCFYTTDKDRALDPSTPLYIAESLIKVRNGEKIGGSK